MGDFNLDYSQKDNLNFRYKNMFEDLDAKLSDKNLIQIIDFPTWSRLINNVLKESILDHVYLTG